MMNFERQEVKEHFPIIQNSSFIINNYYLSAAIPGSSFPSKYSSIAPPPVDT